MSFRKSLLFFLFLYCSLSILAQNRTYQGTVYGADGEPLLNVAVSGKDSENRTKTDKYGYYSITLPDTVLTIIFEHPQMKPASASLGFQSTINISMVGLQSGKMAELSLEDLMNISVTVSSTKEENILSAVSTVTIIDKTTIDKFQFETVQEALQTVAGIDIYRTYLKRNLATSRGILQDHYANKVLIMINNIPVWHAVTGEGCIDRINIHDVEKIEVLKGPASVLYGTNAYSGAINIVLLENADYSNSTYAKAGNNGQLGAGSHVLLNQGNRNLFVGANIESARGYENTFIDESDSSNTIYEYLNTRNITGILRDEHTSFIINYYEADESYLGVTPNYRSGAGNPHMLKGLIGGIRTKYDLSKSLSMGYLFEYDWNNRDLSRRGDDLVRARIDGYRVNNQLSLTYFLQKNLDFEIGGNWEFRRANNYDNYYVPSDTVISRNNMCGIGLNEYSAFGHVNYRKDKIYLTLGSRYTHNELFNNNLSSRISLIYKLNSSSSLKFIYGESFRAPSLFEQNFTTSTYTVVGNRNLVPENSRSVELAFIKRFEKLFLQLTPYYAAYRNKIFRRLDYYIPAGDSVNIYTNGASFEAAGIEVEMKYINSRLVNAFANVNYIVGNDGDRIAEHYNFKYVPKLAFTAGVSKSIKGFQGSVVANIKGGTGGPVKPIGPMYKVDLNLAYTHRVAGKKVSHRVSLKNIGNSEYLIAEHVRLRTLNDVPQGFYRSIFYTLRVNI